MTFKESLLNSLAVYKKNFGKLLVPILVMQLLVLLPLLFFTMPGTVNMARALLVTFASFSLTGEGRGAVLYVLVYMLLALMFVSPLIVSNTVYVVDKDYSNERVTFRQSFAFSRGNYGSMLKSYFATIVVSIPMFFVIVLLLSHMFITGFDLENLQPADIVSLVASAVMFLAYLLGTVFLPYIVVAEDKAGFAALWTSFRYIYRGDFLVNLLRLVFVAILVGGLVMFINWLSQLPFKDLFYLYLEDPRAAMAEPLMVFALLLSVMAIFLVALILPFWYAFSYNTYRVAKSTFEKKHGKVEYE